MRIGITFDLKTEHAAEEGRRAGLPDDFQEEFDSPATIDAIASVLRDLGHDVVLLGDGRDFLKRVLADPPDFVFNFAEGHGISRSREARVPAVLEMLGIPYTGSDPLTLAVTLDKDCAKRLVASAGVAVPKSVVIPSSARRIESAHLGEKEPVTIIRENCNVHDAIEEVLANVVQSSIYHFQYPAIIKPAWEGSSKGIRNRCLVHDPEQAIDVIESLRRDHRQPILLEEFVTGDELTVGMFGNDSLEILGVMRVVPRQQTEHFVYSLEIKRDFRKLVEYECPAPLPAAVMRRVREAAVACFRALGCRDVARIDFRLRDGVPYFLEVNPLPGLHPDDSDLVIMAKLVGWDYKQLVGKIVQSALDRQAELCLTEQASGAASARRSDH
jgi:D-alanine-D-alanine ligase